MEEGDNQQHSDISKSVCLKLDDIIYYIYFYILYMQIYYVYIDGYIICMCICIYKI